MITFGQTMKWLQSKFLHSRGEIFRNLKIDQRVLPRFYRFFTAAPGFIINNFREYQMRVAISPHHTNPRSSTLDFWRKTTDIERYRVIQAQKKKQINIPTRLVANRLLVKKIRKNFFSFWRNFEIEGY